MDVLVYPFTSWKTFGLWIKPHLHNLHNRFLCKHQFSLLLDEFLGVGLLGQMVNTCLTFKETAKLFSKVVRHFAFLQSVDKGFCCCTSWSALGVSSPSSRPKRPGCRGIPPNFWFAISLMTNDIEHLFTCLLDVCPYLLPISSSGGSPALEFLEFFICSGYTSSARGAICKHFLTGRNLSFQKFHKGFVSVCSCYKRLSWHESIYSKKPKISFPSHHFFQLSSRR